MNLTTTRGMLGVVLAFGLAGAGAALILPELRMTDQGNEPPSIRDLLRDQKPRHISYLSFPITGHLAEQLEARPKTIRFPGERSEHSSREPRLQR